MSSTEPNKSEVTELNFSPTEDATTQLENLRKEVGVVEANKHTTHKEFSEAETKIRQILLEEKTKNKDATIKFSKVERDKLIADIKDPDSELKGKLKVENGEIKFDAHTETQPVTPVETPVPAIPENTDVKRATDYFAIPKDAADSLAKPEGVKVGFLQNFVKGIREFFISIKEMMGADVSEDRAIIEGYSSFAAQKKTGFILEALTPFMGESINDLKSPAGAPKTKEEELVRAVEQSGLPPEYTRASIKYIFTGAPELREKLSAKVDEDLLLSLRGKYLSLSENNGTIEELSPRQKVLNIFDMSDVSEQEKDRYIIEARADEEKKADSTMRTGVEEPIENEPAPSPQPIESPEIQKKRMDITNTYAHLNLVVNPAFQIPEKADEITKIESVKVLQDFKTYRAKLVELGAVGLSADPTKLEDIPKWFADNGNKISPVENELKKIIAQKQSNEGSEKTENMTKLSSIEAKLAEINVLIGATGKKALKPGEVISLNQKIKEIDTLLIDVKKVAENFKDPEFQAKLKTYLTQKGTIENTMKEKNLNVARIKTDFDENVKDWGEKLDNIKNPEWLRLLAISDEGSAARAVYIEVENFGEEKEHGVLRLRLDSAEDDGAAFMPWEDVLKTGDNIDDNSTDEQKIQHIKDVDDHLFRTIEKDGSGIIDDDLEWKKDTGWVNQIRDKLGLDLSEDK